jgi:hypothetical protein
MQEPQKKIYFPHGTPASPNVYRTEGREAVRMGITPVLPVAGQKFLQYFKGYLEIFLQNVKTFIDLLYAFSQNQ